jgi:NADH dehydrogenase (ubiquinone) 1 alpha/beta subcomplex 1
MCLLREPKKVRQAGPFFGPFAALTFATMLKAFSRLTAFSPALRTAPAPLFQQASTSMQKSSLRFSPFFVQQQLRSYTLPAADVTSRIVQVVKAFEKVDPNVVKETSHFATDLGLDSLDAVELVMAFEDEFAIEIPDADADKIVSVKDAVSYILSHPNAK